MAVYKRGKTWTARVFWRDQQNKRHSHSKGGFRTKKEAMDYWTDMDSKHNKGVNIGENPEFVEYFWQCYEVFNKPNCRYETRRSYKTAKGPLEDYWGHTKIKEITPTMWQGFLNKLGKHYAKSSVKSFHKKYHSAIRHAIQDGIIVSDFTYGTNITGTTKRTRYDKVQLPSLSHIQEILNKLLERRSPYLMSAKDITFYGRKVGLDKGNICDYVLALQIITGVRIGEALGLRWRDLHPQNFSIDIHHSYNSDIHKLGPTKNKASYRTITVNPQIFPLLEELRKHNHSEFVFGSPTTGLPPTSNATGDELRRVLELLKLPKDGFTTHTLRHAHVAILIHKKIDWYYIMHRLGHSNVKTTIDTYGYLIEETKQIDEQQIIGLFKNAFA
ncbi:site-specific integrase [uncultured Lactobacillus sp.]|uniref:site-specific integrase n=1 Tax=uncultured Lactobacillus sp. TaxID=153152 RepID=UPI00262E6734|nr:site-specific integrase [uncultured Lactobacillus sp.]